MTGAPWSASASGRDQGDILVRRLSPDDDFVKVLPLRFVKHTHDGQTAAEDRTVTRIGCLGCR